MLTSLRMNSRIIETAKSVLRTEAQALHDMAETLDDQFVSAVKAILEIENHGHVIVSGMGKAGLIGTKISATLASIGTASFFLHPAEALHGDLGRYRKNDIALILSNSGETEEIIKTIPAIRSIGCPIISITAVPDSNLAKLSDLTIAIGNSNEAGSLGLAPTTSTCKMLAIGDALAMCLMQEKGMSAKDFAFYHPGGNLGRALVKVSELMRTGEEMCVLSDQLSLQEVIKSYSATKGRPGAAVLVNKSGEVTGIFTDGDLRRCLDHGINFLSQSVSSVMGKSPKSVHPDLLAIEALKVMSQYKIDQIIVMSDDLKPLGMLDIQDICFLVPGAPV